MLVLLVAAVLSVAMAIAIVYPDVRDLRAEWTRLEARDLATVHGGSDMSGGGLTVPPPA